MKHNIEIKYQCTITLSESEMRALDALTGYGDDAFLEVFYKLGKHYMHPHEKGLRNLFERIREEIPPRLNTIDKARKSVQDWFIEEGKTK